MNQDGRSTGLEIPEFHPSAMPRQLEKQSWRQQYEEYDTHKHRPPIRHLRYESLNTDMTSIILFGKLKLGGSSLLKCFSSYRTIRSTSSPTKSLKNHLVMLILAFSLSFIECSIWSVFKDVTYIRPGRNPQYVPNGHRSSSISPNHCLTDVQQVQAMVHINVFGSDLAQHVNVFNQIITDLARLDLEQLQIPIHRTLLVRQQQQLLLPVATGDLLGYLSEVALTSHLSSLKLEESELSKGSAAAEAERRVNILSKESSSSNEDQVFLKHTLAAVRNSAQAAARIQSAFCAHSFQKKQQREAAVAIDDANRDEYCILAHNIRGISELRSWRSAMTLTRRITNMFGGLASGEDKILDEKLRERIIFQAHVRGYQVRKNCKVCWAVGILDKVILRWHRGGVGLRGFRHDSERIDESEDEDILKVLRKQKVDAAIDEAVSRVLFYG
ncbi:UNVERIFIED_CONTAM: Calmodulin-binding transcription activator 4 [Sesamum radiatum]|uniref:Calmodulin-binding transcription activator 4 n=1 Tax=Sesamum radiatum TaxID=300843 RepID=A0AAW2TU05_SESRA